MTRLKGQKVLVMSLEPSLTLDGTRISQLLKRRKKGSFALPGVEFKKRAIASVVQNNTGTELVYNTTLENGKREAEGGRIPPGFWAAVQPNGEIGVLIDSKRRMSHGKLYEMDNPLTFEDALVEASRHDLTVTTPEQVAAVRFANGITAADLPLIYARSKGHVKAYRFTIKLRLPKPSWGEGVVQVAELDSIIVWNLILDEVYFIGWEEFRANWYPVAAPQASSEEMRQMIPAIPDLYLKQILAQ